MRLVRIGVAAVSVKVGDFAENGRRIKAAIEEARRQGVHLLVTPELVISGYSLGDRVWWPGIAERSWETLEELASAAKGISVFVGLPVSLDSLMYNATALIHDCAIQGLIFKQFLPSHNIFYEGCNWTAWHEGVTELGGVPAGDLLFRLPFGVVSAEICEDLWFTNSPARDRVFAGAEIICNGNASPFTPLKNNQRRRLVRFAAKHMGCVYAYSNLLGCDSSRLVFDGGGFVATPDRIVAEGPLLAKTPWTVATGDVDLDDVARTRAENSTRREEAAHGQSRNGKTIVDISGGGYRALSVLEYAGSLPENLFSPDTQAQQTGLSNPFFDELFDALVLGLRDYFEKVGVFERFLVALSGGRDSALCLLLAVNAAKSLNAGKPKSTPGEHVSTVYLPNKPYSSDETETASRKLAEELGVPYQVVSITEEAEIALGKVAELVGDEKNVTPKTRENLQARVRGSMMLNWANCVNGLLLVTSNLSEAAVGYTTTGGDNQGGYSPIANIPKTIVSRLLEYIGRRDGIKALDAILAIPPSAELAPDQKDEVDLMPYVLLDDLLYMFAKRHMTLADCWRLLCKRHTDYDPEQLRAWTADFGKRFASNQWKRDQHPVTLKVMDLDLDPKSGFRFPVTQSIQYELDALEAARLDD